MKIKPSLKLLIGLLLFLPNTPVHAIDLQDSTQTVIRKSGSNSEVRTVYFVVNISQPNIESCFPTFFDVVFDVKNDIGSSISFAVVTLNGTSNAAGDYTFKGIEPGDYTYGIKADGHNDVSGTIKVVNSNEYKLVTMQRKTFVIQTEVIPSGGGTATGSGSYRYDEQVNLIAIPSTAYQFINWTENGQEYSNELTYSFFAHSNRLLQANFSLKTYEINVSVNPFEGGTANGAGTYAYGVEAILRATANSGYAFLNWTEGGTIFQTTSEYRFPVTSNRNLIANFQVVTSVPLISSNESAFVIFPNPARNGFTIKMQGNVLIRQVQVLDILGKEVIRVTHVNSVVCQVVSESISSGVYLVKIIASDKIHTGRIQIIN